MSNKWNDLIQAADESVLNELPLLRPGSQVEENTSSGGVAESALPLRLWKSTVPVEDSSILFVGKLMLGNHFRAAEVQALYACAVLDDVVSLLSSSVMEVGIAEKLAWCRRRYLKKVLRGNWYYFDTLP
ncbi:hypothetical protein LTR09_000323 [Extremus antarcticus]|uniref:Uncharacterized protein n=1 Tax=Extremus antarcticus TaxID=702011 RepID=A0AAJ0GJJ6_9PEZI|nr:hypothetical protein LTR09_000323 [Extremus antarcticus]